MILLKVWRRRAKCAWDLRLLKKTLGTKSVPEEVLFRPAGACSLLTLHPRLTPWAAFLRRFAAQVRHVRAVRHA